MTKWISTLWRWERWATIWSPAQSWNLLFIEVFFSMIIALWPCSLFVDMKHGLQKDEEGEGLGEGAGRIGDEFVWERNSTHTTPTLKTQAAGHVSTALTAATDLQNMHDVRRWNKDPLLQICTLIQTHSAHTHTHKGLVCRAGQSLQTSLSG